MTLELPGVDTLPPVHLRQEALSQYFTPIHIAHRLARLAGMPARGWRILEPSAGDGDLVDAIRDVAPECEVDAVEIDPRYANSLRHRYRERVHVECTNYLARPAPTQRYELAIMNPPYECGADGRFVEKAMDESHSVIALCRLNFLVGKDRYARIWSRIGVVEDGCAWSLATIAFFASRPSFIIDGAESGSPQSDFVAVHLIRRRAAFCNGTLVLDYSTRVEWWT